MKAVKYLMIGKDATLQSMVNESFMQGTVNRFKRNLIAPFLKNITQTIGLFHTIRADIKTISPLTVISQ